MRATLARAAGRRPSHLPATASDLLFYGCLRAAPRFLSALEVTCAVPPDEASLREALRRTALRLPILTARFASGPLGARWLLLPSATADRLLQAPITLQPTGSESTRAALAQAREAALREPLEAVTGQLCRLHRFDLPDGSQTLFLVGNPMVGDPLAWLAVLNVVLEELQAVGRQAPPPTGPDALTTASRSLASLLLQQPRLTRHSLWPAANALLRTHSEPTCLWEEHLADSVVVHRSLTLDQDRVAALRAEAERAGGTLSDVLIAAVARACDHSDLGLCRDRQGNNLLRLGLAVDLRRFARRATGIGNFISVQVTTLELPLPGTLAALVMQIRAQIQRGLERGAAMRLILPLTVLGQMPPALASRVAEHALRRPLPLSLLTLNLGRAERLLPGAADLPVTRVTLYPPAASFLPLTVSASSWAGALTINVAFASTQFAPDEVDLFARTLKQRLNALIG